MTTLTLTLSDFLLARIAEDEELAEAASERGQRWTQTDPVRDPGLIEDAIGVVVYDEGRPDHAQAAHMARHDPARVLADCKAKRGAIEAAWADHERIEGEWGECRGKAQMEGDNDYPAVVLALAQPYADHEDFRDEWRS